VSPSAMSFCVVLPPFTVKFFISRFLFLFSTQYEHVYSIKRLGALLNIKNIVFSGSGVGWSGPGSGPDFEGNRRGT